MGIELPPTGINDFDKEIVPPPLTKKVVFIRKPGHIDQNGPAFTQFCQALESNGRFTVAVIPEPEDDPSNRYYPTDDFRQIGDRTIIGSLATSYMEETLAETSIAPQTRPEFRNPVEAPIVGGDYVYLTEHKIFIYAEDKLSLVGPEPDTPEYQMLKDYYAQFGKLMADEQLTEFFKTLTNEGWQIRAVQVKDLEPVPFTEEAADRVNDLDFHFSLFLGRDGQTHALVAEAFVDRVPDIIDPDNIHVIPTREVVQGGCNVADLDNGTVLISPNRKNAPTTYGILQELAQAEVIEAPEDFLEGGGGPRCSISAVEIEFHPQDEADDDDFGDDWE